MKQFGGTTMVAGLMSFNAGFVDTTGFLGLHGLFVAHVTGNFVTLGAALVTGSHGIIGKLLAIPAFILVIMLARLAGVALRRRNAPVLRILLSVEVALLFTYFALAVTFGPFENADAPLALLTGFAGIAAMALQTAMYRVHFGGAPPTTFMTGNTTQATIDIVDLLSGAHPDRTAAIRARFGLTALSIACFGLGCVASAILFWLYGWWCLAAPVVIGAIAAVMRAEKPKTLRSKT